MTPHEHAVAKLERHATALLARIELLKAEHANTLKLIAQIRATEATSEAERGR
jgi:hypothetical protein